MPQSKLLLVGLLVSLFTSESNIFTWSGPLQDTQCDVESVEDANKAQLHAILHQLMNTTYFRLARINMDQECMFWKEQVEPECTTILPFQSEPACSLDLGTPGPFPWSQPTDDIDRTLLKQENDALSDLPPCEDENHPAYWLDICANIPTNASEYVNLQVSACPEKGCLLCSCVVKS
jgi:hypothetical protein